MITFVRRTINANRETRLGVVTFLFIIYAVIAILLFDSLGAGIGPLSMVPVAATGGLFGVPGGILAGIIAFPLHTLIYSLADKPALDIVLRLGGGPGSIILILSGGLIGWMRDLQLTNHILIGKLRERSAELDAVFSSLPDLIFVLDSDAIVRDYRAGNAIGFSSDPQAITGRRYDQLLPDEAAAVIRDGVAQLKQTGEMVNVDYSTTHSGEVRWHEARIAPAADERVIVLVRDITRQKTQEENERTIMREREQIRVLSEFIQNVSHDLRTPLASIKASLYLLNKTRVSDPEAYVRYSEVMQSQIKRLTDLIDAMLTMTRLDTTEELVTLAVDLNDLVRNACKPLLETYGDTGARLEMKLAESLPSAQLHEEYLTRTVANLVENAFQNTPAGGIITVTTSLEDNGLQIKIADTGEGIPPDDLPLVFERFYRVAKHRPPEDGGSGLGLSFARKAVEKHGGNVEITSEVGRGTTVSVRLPIGQVINEALTAS